MRIIEKVENSFTLQRRTSFPGVGDAAVDVKSCICNKTFRIFDDHTLTTMEDKARRAQLHKKIYKPAATCKKMNFQTERNDLKAWNIEDTHRSKLNYGINWINKTQGWYTKKSTPPCSLT